MWCLICGYELPDEIPEDSALEFHMERDGAHWPNWFREDESE